MKRGKRRSSYSQRPRDLEYMRFVKSLPCCKCGRYEVEAHHAGARAFGQKADDRTCIPLCSVPCHADISKLNEFPDKAARREWTDSKIAETMSEYLSSKGQL